MSNQPSTLTEDIDNQETITLTEEIDNQETTMADSKTCCSCLSFEGVYEAKGFALLGITRGTIIMTNIFLSTSLLYLARNVSACLLLLNVEWKVFVD